MKKWLRYIVAFVLVVSTAIQIYKTAMVKGDTVEVVRENKEVSLNDFLHNYKKWLFTKIALEDETSLIWYEYLETGASVSFMTVRKNLIEQYVNVYETKKPLGTSLSDLWISMTGNVTVDVKFNEQSWRSKLFSDVWPLLILLVVFVLIFKFAMPKGGGGFPFSVKAGKLNNSKTIKTKFSDVAGMEEVKMELSEMVDYLKNPAKYHKVWARHPKWVLLYGQPGSGKTLLARAVAWESNVPFFSASWSEFMEMLVGMWAAKVRELFGKAKAAGRAIIFIDEIDAIGKKRGVGYTWGHQEQEQTLNQILTEMDGFDNMTQIIVIAATNRPDVLDPALMRAWRFDRKVYVSEPTYEERIQIFEYYLKGKKINKDVNISSLAKRTSGLVGADIENIVNEAALKQAKEERKTLEQNDFEYALEKVIMGPEKKVNFMKENEKKIIAFHELGHAVTSHVLPNADPVEKISIVRRGHALWVTRMTPNEDMYLYSKAKFLDQVTSLLWGRAAEEIFFWSDNITTWASNDFEKATEIITNMIVKYGMDKELGPVSYYDKNQQDYPGFKTYSEKTAQIIDEKVKSYIADCYDQSKKLIIQNKKLIEDLSLVLLDKEYLTREEFESMMQHENKPKKTVKK